MSAPAVHRDPADWIEDMTWHRRMYNQSKFRWVPEDAMGVALTWTRGRLAYETPGQLRLLDEQIMSLKGYAAGIEDAMLDPLAEARQRCRGGDYAQGLHLVNMTPMDVEILRHSALAGTGPVRNHRQARRALRGIPLPNPFSQVWELRQMRGMYTAAENILEDLFADLALELAPTQGWDYLASLSLYHCTGRSLQQRVDQQRQARGELGDPRRQPQQRYTPSEPPSVEPYFWGRARSSTAAPGPSSR